MSRSPACKANLLPVWSVPEIENSRCCRKATERLKMRITRVYTKTGDTGETSLVNGDRVSKDTARVAAYGDVDELNSMLGVVRSFLSDAAMDLVLDHLQNDLFILGADLASPNDIEVPRISADLVEGIEGEIDKLMEELEPLKEFILPGGSKAASFLHVARTIARRAERTVVGLQRDEEINPLAVIYLNRLSDYLFVASRVANIRDGVKETLANFSRRNK